MAITRLLAEGEGWRVNDVICTSGPGERRLEEQHHRVCVAMVMQGSFEYRTSAGCALLAPGALMLGNAGQCFECSHEHAIGDRCLSFHFDPAFIQGITVAVPGARKLDFSTPALSPMSETALLFAMAELARDEADADGLEEIAVRIAGAAISPNAQSTRAPSSPTSKDARRITAAVRRIESDFDVPLGLNVLANEAMMSPYHFLRTFRAVVGMTPHQFLLQKRLRQAALRLRQSRENIVAVAFETGFGDLSTFNKQFRRILGHTPGEFRRGA